MVVLVVRPILIGILELVHSSGEALKSEVEVLYTGSDLVEGSKIL